MGDIRFSKRTECWCPFSWSVCNQNGHFIRSIQSSSFQGYGDIHTHHGRTSSAKRNSDQKPKLSERDHRTLKRIVSINHRSTAAKVRAELDIHLEDRSTKTVWRELHKSSIHGRAAIAKPLITENSAKRWKRWCDDHKTWPSDDWKYIIWSDEPSFMLFPTSGWVYIWTSPKEAYNPECLVPTVKHGARPVMIWAAVSSILLLLYMVELLPVTTWIF